MILRLRSLLRSPDTRDGVIMTAATVLAGGFDYLVLVVAGVLLSDPAAIAFGGHEPAEDCRAGHLGHSQRGGLLHRRAGGAGRGPNADWSVCARPLALGLALGLLVALLFGLAAPLTNRLINANSTAAVVAAGLALLFFLCAR